MILTGQLGEVMRESAQAALSIVKNRAGSFGIEATEFGKSDIHIHVPAGAIPKEVPRLMHDVDRWHVEDSWLGTDARPPLTRQQ